MAYMIKGKLIYLAHPRTGSSAVAKALGAIGAKRIGGHHSCIKFVKRNVPVTTEITVTTVRNMFDVVASWHALSKWGDFKKFIREKKHNPYFIDILFFHLPCDVVLRYDTLDEDLNQLLLNIGLPPVKIPRVNVTAGKKPFRDYYDDEAIKLVRERFCNEKFDATLEWASTMCV